MNELKEKTRNFGLSPRCDEFLKNLSNSIGEDEYFSLLNALRIANYAHQGQKRKFGSREDYINHPIRVAESFSTLEDDYCIRLQIDSYIKLTNPDSNLVLTKPNLQIVSLLHDVLEDSSKNLEDPITEIELAKLGIPTELIDSLKLLTKIEGENYYDFIMRISKSHNPLAIRVKIEDINDNLKDLHEGSFKDKYRLAKHILESKLFSIIMQEMF